MIKIFHQIRKDKFLQFLILVLFLSIIIYVFKYSTDISSKRTQNSNKQLTTNSNSVTNFSKTTATSISLSGEGVSRQLTKKGEHWIVDERGSEESDSTSLNDVVYSAKNGDRIIVKKGEYYIGQSIIEKDLIIEGEAKEAVKINFSQTQVNDLKLSVKNLTMVLENDYNTVFKIINSQILLEDIILIPINKKRYGHFFELNKSRLKANNLLSNHDISGENKTTLFETKNSTLFFNNAHFLHYSKIINAENSKIEISNSKFSKAQRAIVLGIRSDLNINRSRLEEMDKYAISIESHNNVTISDSIIQNCKDGIFTSSGVSSKVILKNVEFKANQYAISAKNLEISGERVKFNGNAKDIYNSKNSSKISITN
jgi:hypothetical protein